MKKIIRTTTVIILALMFIKCSESISDNKIANQAPDTFTFLYTSDTVSQQNSRLKVHWWGDDPDGLISGYYFKWEGLSTNWTFTTKNDSLFSLPIGTVDTTFAFVVIAADNQGNGLYDNQVMWNNEDLGPEPFIDSDNNGSYTFGETFYDIGLIDQTPAKQDFPIKNSAPEFGWAEDLTLPANSLPVTTINWTASDLDGDESIVSIQIALNDTSNFVEIEGNIRLVTLRGNNLDTPNPTMQILLNGSGNNVVTNELNGLKLDDNNIVYLRGRDISGAYSDLIQLPQEGSDWFVTKPRGKFLLVNDYPGNATVTDFYKTTFDAVNGGALAGKYDEFDLTNLDNIAFPNITFLETMKLYDYVYWYSSSKPNLNMANIVTQQFLQSGGKIAYSMTFEKQSTNFAFDLSLLQSFIPVDSLGQDDPYNFLIPPTDIFPAVASNGYPNLRASLTLGFIRTFHPNITSSDPVLVLSHASNPVVAGTIGFMVKDKNLFFVGVPLHSCNAIEGSVEDLFQKVFFEEFGMSL